MTSRPRFTVLIGATILATAVVLAAWPGAGDTPRTDDREPGREKASLDRPVQVATVDRAEATREVRLPGVTRASERATLAFTVAARVATRPADVGDAVARGQVLATLDDHELRLAARSAAASVAEIEARLGQARRDQERVQRLVEARAATREELERVQSATASLEAGLEAAVARRGEAHRRLDESVLVAPFAGTVTAVHLEAGEWASPGMPVLELAGSGAVELYVEVPESVRPGLATGSPVEVELPLVAGTASGRVRSVADATVGAGGLFPVVVDLDPSPGLVAGLAAEARLQVVSAPGLVVPLAAVLDPGSSRPAVFRVTAGRAERVAVTPGRVVGDRLQVRAQGLAAGDQVVTVGHTALVDGDTVEVF